MKDKLANPMKIFVENLQKHYDLPSPTPKEVLKACTSELDFPVIAVSKNGALIDWELSLKTDDKLKFLSFQDKKGKECYWHSSAHILAQAISHLYPTAKPTIGPPIDNGFYYDFYDLNFSEKDFSLVEDEIEKIIAADYPIVREEIASKQAADTLFQDNPFKRELIEEYHDQGLSLYRQGDFFDLCRGPHVESTGKIKRIKILKTAGAYWRGDSKQQQLTRVYAISFPSKQELKDYLTMLEEAQKRDHRVVGPKLDLFSFQDESPGMPFIHPRGLTVWNELVKYSRELRLQQGYQEIKTPSLMKKKLWEVSGHWDNYKQNMYLSHVDDEDYAIKPMNCPGACVFYKAKKHSYRDLPLRLAEIGHVHRHELSGALSGLFRVRSFHQDDSHIFAKRSDLKDEVKKLIRLCETIYSTFGLKFHFELSTQPDNSIGSQEFWDFSTETLQTVLEELGHKYQLNAGDGAFYGPKIDAHVRDALGRFWQCGTIQLDLNFPARFDLTYTNDQNQEERPIMLHCAIYGSIERFLGILIEHFSGNFPFWLAPEQVAVLPISEKHLDYAGQVLEKLQKASFRAFLDQSNESLNKKIRNAQVAKVNYMLVIGDKERDSATVTLRTRSGTNHEALALENILSAFDQEWQSKSLTSSF